MGRMDSSDEEVAVTDHVKPSMIDCQLFNPKYRAEFKKLFQLGRRLIDENTVIVNEAIRSGTRHRTGASLEIFFANNLTVEETSAGMKALFCSTNGCMNPPEMFDLYCRPCKLATEINSQPAAGEVAIGKGSTCSLLPPESQNQEIGTEGDHPKVRVQAPNQVKLAGNAATNSDPYSSFGAEEFEMDNEQDDDAMLGARANDTLHEMGVHEAHPKVSGFKPDGVIIGSGSNQAPGFIPSASPISPINESSGVHGPHRYRPTPGEHLGGKWFAVHAQASPLPVSGCTPTPSSQQSQSQRWSLPPDMGSSQQQSPLVGIHQSQAVSLIHSQPASQLQSQQLRLQQSSASEGNLGASQIIPLNQEYSSSPIQHESYPMGGSHPCAQPPWSGQNEEYRDLLDCGETRAVVGEKAERMETQSDNEDCEEVSASDDMKLAFMEELDEFVDDF